MTVSVLVVDDSGFFRKRLTEILTSSGQIKVVGAATNGREGVELAEKLRPDVITMDYEMPVMDGISAVREIMRKHPIPVLMFSSLTYEGARVTLDALEAGAVDFLPKNFEEIARDNSQLQKILIERILDVARSRPGNRSPAPSRAEPSAPASRAPEPAGRPRPEPAPRQRPDTRAPAASAGSAGETEAPRRHGRRGPAKHYAVVGIGTSTGGPVALQRVLTVLPATFPAPIVLVQHMPENFTRAFAERLNRQCQIQVREAQEGDTLQPGVALLAPGGKQMMLDARGGLRIVEDERMTYKPSLDITFGSAAKHYGNKVLGVVLTGMGADGREGARMLKNAGSSIWSQDEASCVIYGMPMAVAKAGLSDKVLSLKDIGPRLVREVC